MAAFPVELLKGHDNNPEGFNKLAYVKIPAWLAKKLANLKKKDAEHTWFQVVEETEKAYRILFCKDASMSYGFVRPTWYLEYISKSIVIQSSTDFEACEEEEKNYYLKKWSKK